MKLTDLTIEQQIRLLDQINARTNQEQQTIEKDWWVTQVLKALFSLPYAKEMSLKGGTSLSKAWGFIERFSEDIDIGIDRRFLGFTDELSKTQISDKLRRKACTFVREKMQFDLKEMLLQQGISESNFDVKVNITPITTTDPEVILIDYQSVLPMSEYIEHTVKVEVSGRSMLEPINEVLLESLLDKYLPDVPVAEPAFYAFVVDPKRTFLEKIMLLHEEFAKAQNDLRTERMSRHLYDIYKMMLTTIATSAIEDEELYRSVVERRRKFIGMKDFDYNSLYSDRLSLKIPSTIINLWKIDYEKMCKTMIFGNAPLWDELIESIQALNNKIKSMHYYHIK